MLFPYTLQYPEVIQKVQYRGDCRTRRCSSYCDLGGDGEPATMLRVDVDQRRDQSSYRIEKPDAITPTSVNFFFSLGFFIRSKQATYRKILLINQT